MRDSGQKLQIRVRRRDPSSRLSILGAHESLLDNIAKKMFSVHLLRRDAITIESKGVLGGTVMRVWSSDARYLSITVYIDICLSEYRYFLSILQTPIITRIDTFGPHIDNFFAP